LVYIIYIDHGRWLVLLKTTTIHRFDIFAYELLVRNGITPNSSRFSNDLIKNIYLFEIYSSSIMLLKLRSISVMLRHTLDNFRSPCYPYAKISNRCIVVVFNKTSHRPWSIYPIDCIIMWRLPHVYFYIRDY
jgi:hypothetical protein